MKMHLKLITSFLSVFIILVWVSSPLCLTFKDSLGREVTLKAEPQRIVTLAPSLTEIIYFLGLGDRVVGVTKFSYFPPEAALKPRVGSYIDLNVEKIISLSPDLVIGTVDGNQPGVVDLLEQAGIAVFIVNPRNIRQVIDTVATVGRLCGLPEKASTLSMELTRRVDHIIDKTKSQREPLVFLQINVRPIMTINKDTFLHDLIRLAGGRNMTQNEPITYPRISLEEVIRKKPEVIIISSMERGGRFEQARLEWLKWTSIPAVKNGRVHLIDSDLIDRPSPSGQRDLALHLVALCLPRQSLGDGGCPTPCARFYLAMETTIKRPLTPGRVVTLSLIMCLVLLLIAAVSLMLGTAQVSLGQVIGVFTGTLETDDPASLILLKIRLPRIILAGLVGFALSLGGVVFQALLRNPLADPFILGVSSGSAFGAVLAIVFGLGFSFGVPVMSFAGALLTIYLLMTLGARKMGMESSTILLTGVIINAFFTAIIMFFIAIIADARLHSMLFWLYGDLSQSRYTHLAFIAPILFIASIILYGFARHLNLITAGEETALGHWACGRFLRPRRVHRAYSPPSGENGLRF
jgi:ABC-type Fe3+-hydroxamate transport system substrate-binding protein